MAATTPPTTTTAEAATATAAAAPTTTTAATTTTAEAAPTTTAATTTAAAPPVSVIDHFDNERVWCRTCDVSLPLEVRPTAGKQSQRTQWASLTCKIVIVTITRLVNFSSVAISNL